MSRLPGLVPGALDREQVALYESIAGGPRAAGPQHFALTAADGSLRGPFNAMLLAPRLGAALQGLGAAIRYSGTLPARSREIAILLVAARWDSAFEREAHEAVGRAAGLTEAEVAALRREEAEGFGGVEAAVARAVVAMLDGDLSDAHYAAAREALGEAGVFELATLVGYYATLALQLRVFRVGV